MAKFEALYGTKALIVPFIERDEKGQIVRDQSIVFNQGIITRDVTFPANFITEDADKIRYLRAEGGNEANGGHSFKELIEKASAPKAPIVAVVPKSEPAAVVAPVEPAAIAPAPEAEKPFVFPDDLAEEPSITDYPEVTTLQAASAILKGLFPELTARDTKPKEKAIQFAASKKITFSNLL